LKYSDQRTFRFGRDFQRAALANGVHEKAQEDATGRHEGMSSSKRAGPGTRLVEATLTNSFFVQTGPHLMSQTTKDFHSI